MRKLFLFFLIFLFNTNISFSQRHVPTEEIFETPLDTIIKLGLFKIKESDNLNENELYGEIDTKNKKITPTDSFINALIKLEKFNLQPKIKSLLKYNLKFIDDWTNLAIDSVSVSFLLNDSLINFQNFDEISKETSLDKLTPGYHLLLFQKENYFNYMHPIFITNNNQIDIDIFKLRKNLNDKNLIAKKNPPAVNKLDSISQDSLNNELLKKEEDIDLPHFYSLNNSIKEPFIFNDYFKYKSLYNDWARLATLNGGLKNINSEQFNEFSSMGISSMFNSTTIEGISYENINHLPLIGSNSGITSIFSSKILSILINHIGNTPIHLSNSLHQNLEANLKKGNNKKNNLILELNNLFTEITLNGPIFKKTKNKLDYIINLRSSQASASGTSNLLDFEQNYDNLNPIDPRFFDVYAKFDFNTKENGTISFWSILGSSKTKKQIKDNTIFEINEIYSLNSISQFSYNIPLDLKGYSKIILNYQDRTITNKYYNKLGFSELQTNKDFNETVFTFANVSEYTSSDIHKYKAGFNLDIKKYKSFNFGELEQNLSANNLKIFQNPYTTFYSFIEWNSRIVKFLDITAGVNFKYFGLNNSNFLGFNFKVDIPFQDIINLIISYSTSAKNLESSVYFNSIFNNSILNTNNFNLSLINSSKINFDIILKPTSSLFINSKIYILEIQKLPESQYLLNNEYYSLVNKSYELLNIPLLSKGKANIFGVDINIEKRNFFGFDIFWALSYFDTRYEWGGGFLKSETKYNPTFYSNLLINKKQLINKNSNFDFSIRPIFQMGNKKITYVENSYNSRIPDINNYYKNSLEPYFRLDFSLNYNIYSGKINHSIELFIQNMLNTRNEQDEYAPLNKSENIIKKVNDGITFQIGYKITI